MSRCAGSTQQGFYSSLNSFFWDRGLNLSPELVNQLGSYFYGSLLGVFVLLFVVPKAGGKAALTGLFAGMAIVFFCDSLYFDSNGNGFSGFFQAPGVADTKMLAYLWLNPIGTAAVVVTGWIMSFFTVRKSVV